MEEAGMKTKERVIKALNVAGLNIFEPVVRLFAGEDPKQQLKSIGVYFGVPALAFGLFLLAWSAVAQTIVTKYGTLPNPSQVWTEAQNLVQDHYQSRKQEQEFYGARAERAERIEQQAAQLSSQAKAAATTEKAALEAKAARLWERAEKERSKKYSGSPTYFDQIKTSLKTVFAGFLIASLVAIPVGILCGLSSVFLAAMNPLIQIFKPVSPLAWLPIVMIVVGAVYTTDPDEAWFAKSFVSSAFTVALCSLWPTLVNTALGVASIEKDHINVGRVLNLGFWTRIRRIVIPSALPLMFAGLRISLGVGWMVLIAAEMLAQNPGLGKFVWDMFQNGSSQTLAQIMVAVFTIGLIGLLLDRVMIVLQRSVSYSSVSP
jgi:nitrate/nitrite transport system permease protein